jgi:hypothetical protein
VAAQGMSGKAEYGIVLHDLHGSAGPL